MGDLAEAASLGKWFLPMANLPWEATICLHTLVIPQYAGGGTQAPRASGSVADQAALRSDSDTEN